MPSFRTGSDREATLLIRLAADLAAMSRQQLAESAKKADPCASCSLGRGPARKCRSNNKLGCSS